MNARPSLPVVRLRLPCADRAEYSATRAAEIAANGVLIQSDHARPPGDRVRLEIELLDGSRAYAGPAVVRGPAGEEDGAAGYRLVLDGLSQGKPPALPPGPPSGVAISLAEFLFADLDDGDAGKEHGIERLVPTPRPVRLRLAPTPRHTTPAPVVPPPTPAPSLPTPEARLVTPVGHPPTPVGHPPTPEERLLTPMEHLLSPEKRLLTPPPAPRASEPPPVVPGLEADSDAWQLLEPVLEAADEPEPVSLPRPERSVRRWVGIASSVAAVALLAGAILLSVLSVRAREAREAALAAELQRADQRIEGGQLAGPRGDSALDHLEAAQRLAPHDERVKRRLALLASTFEELGGRALTRAHLAEARAHFQAALRADPGRELARAQLQRLEAAPAGAGRRRAGR